MNPETIESLICIGGPCLLPLLWIAAYAHCIWGVNGRVSRAEKRQAEERETRKRRLWRAGRVVRA
jgi:hypothetical protein